MPSGRRELHLLIRQYLMKLIMVLRILDSIFLLRPFLYAAVTTSFKSCSVILPIFFGFLGIHSPSTVFAGIGENMALGLGNGFTAAMQGVGRTIQKSIPSTSSDITVTGGKKPSAAAGVAPNLTINTHDSLSPYEILQE